MNKQRYLAELQRLLVFMTDEDKEAAVRRYGALFDAAGPEGETELIGEIGSPTKAAIGLSRGYAPGRLDKVLPPAPSPGEGAAVPAEESPRDEETAETPAVEADAPVLPVRPGGEDAYREPRSVVERAVPLGLGIPLFVLVFVALGIPLAAVFLALMAVLLAPGCAVLTGAYLVAVGGLWSLSYMADAILLFGAAFIVLAAGIVLLWAGIWLSVKLAKAWLGFIRWLSGELLGRRVTADE